MDPVDNTVITKRRHPNKTIICAKTAYKPFKDLSKKIFSYPALTYLYNIEINVVNKKKSETSSLPDSTTTTEEIKDDILHSS